MKKIIMLCLFLIVSSASHSQSRVYLRQKIEQWGECKNVAITSFGGDVALHKKNGWASTGTTPKSLTDALDELNEKDELIDDIVLTEQGSWIILYGNNGFIWNNIPYSLEKKIREYNDAGEVILSITLNDNSDWVIISTEKFVCSSGNITEFIKEGMDKYGQVWAVHVTNDGLAVVYEKGFRFFGNVPNTLREKIKTVNFNIFRMKFTSEGSFFIADREGHFSYRM